jgi:hypothetical protein
MTSDQFMPMLLGIGLLSAPALRYWMRSHRAAKKARDAETDQSFMDYLNRMRVAGEEQEADPRTAAIVARFAYSINGTATPSRGGRHRAVPTGGRHRLVTATA